MEKQSKEEIITYFKKLSKEKNWKINLGKIDKWQPIKSAKKYHRSFYTFVYPGDGRKAFFKYPIEKYAIKNFPCEIAYLKYIGENIPSLVPEIYDYSLKKPYWYLVEALDFRNGTICNTQNRKIIKRELIYLILNSIYKLHLLSTFSKELLKFRPPHKKYFKDLLGRNKKILPKLERNKKILPKFPFNKIKKFLQSHKKDIITKQILLHRDFAPDNIYFNKKQKRIIVLDWERAAVSGDGLINKSLDFVNLYLHFRLNKKFQRELLKEFMRKKIATKEQIQASMILHGLGQLYAIIYHPQSHEKLYQKQHIQGIIESFNAIF